MTMAQLDNSAREFDSRFTSLQSEIEETNSTSADRVIDKQGLLDFYNSIENKNAETMKEYMKLTATQQQEYFKEMFTQFNNFYQKQRDDDLLIIQNSLYELTHKQEIQKQETEKALASLFTTVEKADN